MKRVAVYLRIIIFAALLFLGITYPTENAICRPLFILSSAYDKPIMVERVISADTVVLKNRETIHLIGLKAPRPPKKKKVERDKYNIPIRKVSPLTPLNERAYQFAVRLLENKYVRLEFDDQRKDDNLRTLAYVFLMDGTFVNAEILRNGFADLRIVQPNIKYEDRLIKAYQEARKQKRGLQGQ